MPKQNRTKPRIFAGAGAFCTALWTAYSNFSTVTQLPSDAGGLAKMLVDPPVYFPWLVLAGFVLLLAWAFWPTAKETEPTQSQPSSVDNYTNTGINAGHIGPINNFGEQRFHLTDQILEDARVKIGDARCVRVSSYGSMREASDFIQALTLALGRSVIHNSHEGSSNEPPLKGLNVNKIGETAYVSFNPS